MVIEAFSLLIANVNFTSMKNIVSQVQFSPTLVQGNVKQGRFSKFNFDHALHKFILTQSFVSSYMYLLSTINSLIATTSQC